MGLDITDVGELALLALRLRSLLRSGLCSKSRTHVMPAVPQFTMLMTSLMPSVFRPCLFEQLVAPSTWRSREEVLLAVRSLELREEVNPCSCGFCVRCTSYYYSEV